jgi:hypothetical protein
MTDEERQRIIAEARRNIEPSVFPPREAPAREWRAEPVVRLRRREPEGRTDAARAQDWAAHVRSEVANAIAAEHEFMIETLGEVLAHERSEFEKLLGDQRRAHEAELTAKIADLRLDLIGRMTATIEQMQRTLRGDADRSGHVLDLREIN